EAPPPAFQLPLERWLRGELQQLVQDTLLGPALRAPGLFDPAMLQSLAEDQEPLTPALAQCLWSLLLLGQWHERVRSEAESANRKLHERGQGFVPRAD